MFRPNFIVFTTMYKYYKMHYSSKVLGTDQWRQKSKWNYSIYFFRHSYLKCTQLQRSKRDKISVIQPIKYNLRRQWCWQLAKCSVKQELNVVTSHLIYHQLELSWTCLRLKLSRLKDGWFEFKMSHYHKLLVSCFI